MPSIINLRQASGSTAGDTTRYGMNVVVTDILFLDAKDQSPSPEQLAEVPGQGEPPVTEEDVPF
jgi:hypothetical protein